MRRSRTCWVAALMSTSHGDEGCSGVRKALTHAKSVSRSGNASAGAVGE